MMILAFKNERRWKCLTLDFILCICASRLFVLNCYEFLLVILMKNGMNIYYCLLAGVFLYSPLIVALCLSEIMFFPDHLKREFEFV